MDETTTVVADEARGSTQASGQGAVRCFMDGIDWEHHLGADADGTALYPSEQSLRANKKCLAGGCGVVEVEVRLVRWVEEQDLRFDEAATAPSTPANE